ncbi:hypothetical protein SAY87_021572 [Trapa incisa]|uniref:ATP-dependent Clp protease proteolytic subunit n=1 Tax=Trapa incisa TaxID=236973 RepID=A0AAN7JTF0_9MYRT|nr:hypothetical protein SAY87_021572 [Trapa incisa]
MPLEPTVAGFHDARVRKPWALPIADVNGDGFITEELVEAAKKMLGHKGQEVDSKISNQLIGLMVYLIENDNKDLYLFINSPGGWVIPGVTIYDTMQFVQPDVHTICMGLAASMGSFILVGGEITKPFPHTWRQ